MYKKILSINNPQATGGLNKAENATSTITLKDLKTPSPMSSVDVHHHQQQQHLPTNTIERVDAADANDENAPSNFAIESAVNSSDKAICERPLASSIQTSPSHHVSPTTPPPPPPSKMETDDYALEHTYPTHKSIHHSTAAHYRDMMVDEDLENKHQNFVNEEDDVWRPW